MTPSSPTDNLNGDQRSGNNLTKRSSSINLTPLLYPLLPTPFLIGGIVVFGSMITLLFKYQDTQLVATGVISPQGLSPAKNYQQPLFQVWMAFFAMTLMLLYSSSPSLPISLSSEQDRTGSFSTVKIQEEKKVREQSMDITSATALTMEKEEEVISSTSATSTSTRGTLVEDEGNTGDMESKSGQEANSLREKPELPLYFYAIPAALQCMEGLGTSIGLLYLPASVCQMLISSNVIFSALLSTFLLGKGRRRLGVTASEGWSIHHRIGRLAGLGLVIIGIILVSNSTISSSQSTPVATTNGSTFNNTIFGVLLILSSQFMESLSIVLIERWLGIYTISHPNKMGGWIGAWGLALLTSIGVIGYVILLGSPVSMVDGPLNFVNIPLMFIQSFSTFSMTISFIFVICSVILYNSCQLVIVQRLSATHMLVIDALRVVMVWIFSVWVGWEDSVSGIQVLGMCILVLGNLLFHRQQ